MHIHTLSDIVFTGEYFHHSQLTLCVSDSSLPRPGVSGASGELHACIGSVFTSGRQRPGESFKRVVCSLGSEGGLDMRLCTYTEVVCEI